MNEEFSAAESKAREAERAAARVDEGAAVAPSGRSLFQRAASPQTSAAQSEFNRAVVTALLEMVREFQNAFADQQSRIAHAEQQAAAVLSMGERIHELQRRTQELESNLEEQLAQNLAQVKARDSGVEEIVETLRHETRDRMQSLLDEQRVCLRQLALQTSEEAVLADRARRATELRLEEMAQTLQRLK